jgi:hypothetical protein
MKSARVPLERDTGGSRRLVLHLLEPIHGETDGAVRRRFVQIHRPMEALRRRALVHLQEPTGRVFLGLDGPNLTPPAQSLVTTASDKRLQPARHALLHAPPGPDAYATVSKGFRPGGANQILPPALCGNSGTLKFGPDSAWNYELGEKAKLFDNWLTINSDVYYIKWTDIQQVLTLPCGYQFYNNAGDGRTFGPELEINAKLTTELDRLAQRRLHGREDHPSECVVHQLPDKASRLPRTASRTPADGRRRLHRAHHERGQGHRQPFADLQHHRAERLPASPHASPTHSSARRTMWRTTSPTSCRRTTSPMRAWGSRTTLVADLFVDNLTNKVALMTANNTSFQFNIPQVVRYTTNQPRTVGVQVNYKFGLFRLHGRQAGRHREKRTLEIGRRSPRRNPPRSWDRASPRGKCPHWHTECRSPPNCSAAAAIACISAACRHIGGEARAVPPAATISAATRSASLSVRDTTST